MDWPFCFFLYYILPSNNLHISKSFLTTSSQAMLFGTRGHSAVLGWNPMFPTWEMPRKCVISHRRWRNYIWILIIKSHQVRYLAGFSAFWVTESSQAPRAKAGGWEVWTFMRGCVIFKALIMFVNSRNWESEAVFKEKHGVWDIMPELTITHLIFQSTP